MVWSLFLAVALGLLAYRAAERKGRSPAFWLLAVTGTVLASYYAAYLAAQGLAGSNAIFTDSGSVAAIAVIIAGPLAGIASGAGVIAWLTLHAPHRFSLASPIRVHGGFEGGEQGECFVAVRDHALVLTRGDEEQLVEIGTIEAADVDGEYLVVRVRDETTRLLLRAIGDEHAERHERIALVRTLAGRLVDRA